MARTTQPGLYTTHLCVRIVDYCLKLGLDLSELLGGTGLTERLLYETDARVTVRQTAQLAANSLKLTRDPGLGLKIGGSATPAEGGIAALAASTGSSFQQRVKTYQKYYRLSGQILVPHWTSEGDLQAFRVSAPEPLGDLLPFFVEEALCNLREAINHNYQINMIPAKVRLAYDAPAYRGAYRDYFQCDVEFNAADSELLFDFLSLPER